MRKYTKSNPEKEAFSQPKKNDKRKAVSLSVTIKDAGKNYRKAEGILPPISFIVIISGGEVREKNYFRTISNQDKFRRIKIEFIADPQRLNPDGLLELARYKQERYKTSQESVPDSIFIISDVDHFYNDLVRINPECKKENISLIVSNPCFEIWLYYGKFDSKPEDFDIPKNPLKTSKLFKNYLGRKVKGGVNPTHAIFDITKAIQNAKKKIEKDDNNIPKLFSTDMFLLAEEILPLIDSELKKLNAENKLNKTSYTINEKNRKKL